MKEQRKVPKHLSMDNLIADPGRARIFRDFLRQCYAEESLDYLMEVKQLQTNPSLETVRQIYDLYLDSDGEKQTGVSVGVCQAVLASLESQDLNGAMEGLQEGAQELSTMLEIDKLNAFSESGFFKLLEKRMDAEALLMDQDAISAFVRLCKDDSDWVEFESKSNKTQAFHHKSSKFAEHKASVFTQKERLSFPNQSVEEIARVVFNDHLHQCHYYTVCVDGELLERFDENFQVVQLFFKSGLGVRHVVASGMYKAKLPDGMDSVPDGTFVVMRKSVPYDFDRVSDRGYIRGSIQCGGYLVEPRAAEQGGATVTRLMQLELGKDMSVMHQKSLSKKMSELLAQLRSYLDREEHYEREGISKVMMTEHPEIASCLAGAKNFVASAPGTSSPNNSSSPKISPRKSPRN